VAVGPSAVQEVAGIVFFKYTILFFNVTLSSLPLATRSGLWDATDYPCLLLRRGQPQGIAPTCHLSPPKGPKEPKSLPLSRLFPDGGDKGPRLEGTNRYASLADSRRLDFAGKPARLYGQACPTLRASLPDLTCSCHSLRMVHQNGCKKMYFL